MKGSQGLVAAETAKAKMMKVLVESRCWVSNLPVMDMTSFSKAIVAVDLKSQRQEVQGRWAGDRVLKRAMALVAF